MAYSLKEINHAIRTDPRGFVEESDAAFARKIEKAARKIADNRSRSRIVLLSGPSGSGKTTTAKKIEAQLEKLGIRSHAIAMDDYFLNVDPETAPRNPKGEIDYESPFCLDMPLLNRHFRQLDQGEKILVPKYEFSRQMRSADPGRALRLGSDEIAIFEGIHALNDIITGKNPAATKLYISARANVLGETGEMVFKGTWMRLARRAIRDDKFRAWGPEITIRLWAGVRRGEKLYISPFKDNADIQFDTALPYEVSVMKAYAHPAFEKLAPDVERYEEIGHLLEAYPKFETLSEDYIAPDSLLREFIGGGIYDD